MTMRETVARALSDSIGDHDTYPYYLVAADAAIAAVFNGLIAKARTHRDDPAPDRDIYQVIMDFLEVERAMET